MDIDLAQKAISAALDANWKEAEKLNKELLRENPEDVDALNRLSRASAELGDLKKAKRIAEKALRLDPFNTIAQKSLSKWKGLRSTVSAVSVISQPATFLEEPGKTKLLSLLYLGDSKVIAKLDSGDEVKLTPSSHRVSVTTQDGKYIGRLPDDISARLRKLIALGNRYQSVVKSIEPGDVKVFIREEERAKKISDTPSFPAEKLDYVSFTPPELVHKKEILVPAEEE
jgi:tetratricopeptide (TPR) repeat protein